MTALTPVQLRPGHDRRVRAGHPWVFSNEIDGDVAALPAGGAVEVRDADGRFLGRGYANPASLISVRIVTRDRNAHPDDPRLYTEALRRALAWRERLLPGRASCRLVASEGDGLPGLVIDRYSDVLAVQVTTLGMETRLPLLEGAVREVFGPRGAWLRNDGGLRALEGLPLESREWFGEVPDQVPFEENGVQLVADVRSGQKTGFFFDQAENRAFAARVCAGLDVADVYANTGAWGLAALRAGAASATAVEVNPATCAIIAENGLRNGVADRLEVVAGDARTVMERWAGTRLFGAVFLDPPAFAKSRKKAVPALKGYRDVNRLALRLVVPGGLLFTSSCSHHVLEDRFLEAVLEAARRDQRTLRLARRGEQAPDHPVVPGVPETRYLKHFVFEVR